MTKRPRLLDLFCGAGGCSVGYSRAGFDVVGVDIKPQPSYPFTFIQGDALEFCRAHAHEFDAIHASPPCQAYSVSRHINGSGDRHPDLVDATREELGRSRLPWVMENVVGAPMHRPITLCGLMFGLRVLRHRLFESSELLLAPAHPKHPKGNLTNSKSGYSTGATGYVTCAGNNFVREAGAAAMGIDWMRTRPELAQAIPPAYTEWIGKQLMRQLTQGERV
jgi:DNA (cytosine-5)-methyltransferase 1